MPFSLKIMVSPSRGKVRKAEGNHFGKKAKVVRFGPSGRESEEVWS